MNDVCISDISAKELDGQFAPKLLHAMAGFVLCAMEEGSGSDLLSTKKKVLINVAKAFEGNKVKNSLVSEH